MSADLLLIASTDSPTTTALGLMDRATRRAWLADRRHRLELMAMTVALLNVVDVLLTQLLLRSHPGAIEGNPLLAPVIMSNWVWVPKLALPAVAILAARRRVTRIRELALFAVFLAYWAIVAWNIRDLLV